MSHSLNPGYQAGNHWVECQRCGLDYRKEDIRIEKSLGGHSTFTVCRWCWDPVHPQEFVRARADKIQASGPTNSPAEAEYEEVDFQEATSTIPEGTFNVD